MQEGDVVFSVNFSTYNGRLNEKDFLPVEEKILSIFNDNFDKISLSKNWVDYHFSKTINFSLNPIPFYDLEAVEFKVEIITTKDKDTKSEIYKRDFNRKEFSKDRN